MDFRQVFNNAKWIIVCKIAQSLLQLVIGMLCARYLGPSNYGLINYAASIVAFAVPIMRLGLDSTLVYELVNAPHKEGEIMGTSLVMNIMSSVVCIGGVVAFSWVANQGDKTTIIVCALYSVSLFFAAMEMVQYWFQYKLMSKYSSIVMLVGYIFVSIYKIFLLVTSKSVFWFALTHSVEYGIIAISLIVIFLKKGEQKFSFSFDCAKRLINNGKHYILASLMIMVLQNTDHIMLTNMVGTEENGFYAAAITTAGVVNFVYLAIIDSFRPIILANKKENPLEFEKSIAQLYGIIIYLSVLQSAFFTVFAKPIMHILYGDDYYAAVPVLQILVWYVAFSYMGTVRNIWLLAEEKQTILWRINLSGVVFNIALNAIMIPHWGASGAAFASLLTQIFINFILGFIVKSLRANNKLLIKGINPKFFVSEIRTIIGYLKKGTVKK